MSIIKKPFDYRWGFYESWNELQKRVKLTFETLAKRHANNYCISHSWCTVQRYILWIIITIQLDERSFWDVWIYFLERLFERESKWNIVFGGRLLSSFTTRIWWWIVWFRIYGNKYYVIISKLYEYYSIFFKNNNHPTNFQST